MQRHGSTGAVLLALLFMGTAAATAQDAGVDPSPRTKDSGFELLQNYPNPFKESTRLPFILGTSLFEEGQAASVTMRIFNVLQQLVAHPTALDHPAGSGIAVNGLEYTTPGPKEAFWDGLDLNGRAVAAGVYYLQLIVNGERRTIRIIRAN